LSDREIRESIDDALEKFDAETKLMIKLGHLDAIRNCVADLERRLSEKPV
jgi:hypothetical protein